MNLFDLEDNEQIIQNLKPNKKAFYMSVWYNFFILSIVYFLGIGLMLLGMTFDSSTAPKNGILISAIVFALFYLIIFVVCLFVYKKRYINTEYLITNKKIVIKYGIFSQKYIKLELNQIENINIKITKIDKIIKNKTGNIIFYTKNLTPFSNKNFNTFKLQNIENIIEVYNELKKLINK